MAFDLTGMKVDTVALLAEWGETLVVRRATVSYDDSGISSESYSTIGTYTGDWQPASQRGKQETIRTEAGIQIVYDAIIILEFDENIQENDRVYRDYGGGNEIFEYVIAVRNYEDHITAYLNKIKLGG